MFVHAPCPATPWSIPPGDDDCDGWTTADEGVLGTDPNDPCANTATANDEADDRWPPDFDDNQIVNIIDVLAFDLSVGGAITINIIDVLAMKPVFDESCT